jgi:hypothetical protein
VSGDDLATGTGRGATAVGAGGDDAKQVARRSGDEPARRHDEDGGGSGRAAAEAEKYVDPGVGPSDLNDLPGPFTARQLARIDEALSLATEETGLLFSLYVGDLSVPTRAAAEKLAAALPSTPADGAVLVAVSPGQRVLHVVTTQGAVRRLPNRSCALAALGMRASFAGGDLTAGAITGLRMLADAAGQQSSSHAPPTAPLGR